MIKREFWERVAEAWSKKEEIEIPEILAGPDVPEEPDIPFGEINLDDWKDFLDDLSKF